MTWSLPAGRDALNVDRHLAMALPAFGWMELAIAGLLGDLLSGLISVARECNAPPQQAQSLRMGMRPLPLYAHSRGLGTRR